MSEASGRTAIKAFGNPIMIDTIYHEYNSFDEALKGFTLPKTARVKDGAIMHGQMDSIRLVFEV